MGNQSTVGDGMPQVRSSPSTIHIDDQESEMKALGRKAQAGRKKLNRRAAIQVACYPITKAMLVHASGMARRSLSNFMILASLKEAPDIKGCHVEDLIPPDEYQRYR